MSKPECFIADNGLRTVVQEDRALLHQSFALCVDTSQNPASDLNYPHFLEHILIRDTAQFEGQSYNQLVNESANGSGAATYPETIIFTLDCVPNAVHRLFPQLLETLAEPRLGEEAIERERTVIASEMRERAANAESGLWERAWNNHHFTHTAVQEAAGLGEIDRDKLRLFLERTFTPANLLVVTAGPTPVKDIAHYITESPFQHSVLGCHGVTTRDFTAPLLPIVTGCETEQTTKYLQVINTSTPPEASLVFDQLNNTERAGSFWEKAINEIGVFSAGLYPYRYPYDANARHYVVTEGEVDNIRKVHELSAAILGRWVDQPPSAQALDHVKLSLRNQAIFQGEGPHGRGQPGVATSRIVAQLPQFPAIASIEEQLDKIDRVTPEDIKNLAQTLLEAPRSYSLVSSDDAVERMSGYLS